MAQLVTELKCLAREEDGLETAEALLLLGAVIVPLAYAILQLARWIGRYYAQTSYIISLPFP